MNFAAPSPSIEIVPSVAAVRERVYDTAHRVQVLRNYQGDSVTPESRSALETNLALAGYDYTKQEPVSSLKDMKAALERGDAIHFPHPAGFSMEWSGCEFVCRGAVLENDPQHERLRVKLFDQSGATYSYEIKAALSDLSDRADVESPYERGLEAMSYRVSEEDHLYPLLRLSWQERFSPVVISAISHERQSQQFKDQLASKPGLELITQPTPKLIEHISNLGVSGENYHIVRHESLKLGFVIPTDTSRGVLIIGLDDSGLPRLLPAADQWQTSATLVSNAMPNMDFRMILPNGDQTYGYRGSVPDNKTVAGFHFNYQSSAAHGKMLQQIQEFSSTAEQLLEKKRNESYEFSLSQMVRTARETAKAAILDLADNLHESICKSQSFAGSVQRAASAGESVGSKNPLHLLNQLEAFCHHGLREVRPGMMTLDIWSSMGIDPDTKRSYERPDGAVKLDMSANSNTASYTVYIMPSAVGKETVKSISSSLTSELKSAFKIDSQPAFAGGQISVTTSSLSDVVRILQFIDDKGRAADAGHPVGSSQGTRTVNKTNQPLALA